MEWLRGVVWLQDLASSCALMQLVMMRKLMERSFLKQGWTCKDLEADLGVTLALPTAGGERRGEGRGVQRHADVSLPGAVSVEGVDTLARLKAAVASAADRGSAAQLDGAAGSSAAQLQPPQTDARPGPADAGGAGGPPGGRPAHQTFAATASERDAAAARRPVPLLVVRVRGRPAVLVGLDLISGAVHLHAGESSLYGQVFVTVWFSRPSHTVPDRHPAVCALWRAADRGAVVCRLSSWRRTRLSCDPYKPATPRPGRCRACPWRCSRVS